MAFGDAPFGALRLRSTPPKIPNVRRNDKVEFVEPVVQRAAAPAKVVIKAGRRSQVHQPVTAYDLDLMKHPVEIVVTSTSAVSRRKFQGFAHRQADLAWV